MNRLYIPSNAKFQTLFTSNDECDKEGFWYAVSFDSDIEDYERKIVMVPEWFYFFVGTIFSVLSILGIWLNGFIIWCFAACPKVSNLIILFEIICGDKIK